MSANCKESCECTGEFNFYSNAHKGLNYHIYKLTTPFEASNCIVLALCLINIGIIYHIWVRNTINMSNFYFVNEFLLLSTIIW